MFIVSCTLCGLIWVVVTGISFAGRCPYY